MTSAARMMLSSSIGVRRAAVRSAGIASAASGQPVPAEGDQDRNLDSPLWSLRSGRGPGAAGLSGDGTRTSSGERPAPRAEPAGSPEIGWRRLAWQAGGRCLRPGKRELRLRSWEQQIRRQLSEPKLVVVGSPKGGVGKSTITAGMGHALALTRRDLVAALDANPDSGNLVKRLPGPYSTYTARDLHRHSEDVHRYSDLLPYVTQADSGLCVVRADQQAADRLDAADYERILDLLARFYSLIVVDVGSGLREPASLAITTAADALIMVTDITVDGAEVVVEGIDWLETRFPGRIPEVTLAINDLRNDQPRSFRDRLEQAFGDYADVLLRIPHDPHLALGGVPQWARLAKPTRDAYLRLAASVVSQVSGGPAEVAAAAVNLSHGLG